MQEKQKKWILRIALYLIGIMVLALGITLNTKTNLGVSPIISMPYAVAQIFGYETGTAVFVAYLIFIVLQIVLLKGKFPPFQFLQVAARYLDQGLTWEEADKKAYEYIRRAYLQDTAEHPRSTTPQ